MHYEITWSLIQSWKCHQCTECCLEHARTCWNNESTGHFRPRYSWFSGLKFLTDFPWKWFLWDYIIIIFTLEIRFHACLTCQQLSLNETSAEEVDSPERLTPSHRIKSCSQIETFAFHKLLELCKLSAQNINKFAIAFLLILNSLFMSEPECF